MLEGREREGVKYGIVGKYDYYWRCSPWRWRDIDHNCDSVMFSPNDGESLITLGDSSLYLWDMECCTTGNAVVSNGTTSLPILASS